MAEWAEQWISVRSVASAALILLYASNVVSGWAATAAQSRKTPRRDRHALPALWIVISSLFVPWALKGRMARRGALMEWLSVVGPYLSTFAAAMMGSVHVYWFLGRDFVGQPQLFGFLWAHYALVVAIHFWHLYVLARDSRGGVAQ